MMTALKSIYQAEMFAPGLLGVFINPFYFIRRALYKGVMARRACLHGRLLDFGCGRKPYQSYFDVQEYIGLDIQESGHSHQSESIDVYYDGGALPFGDNYFDSVFSSEVFEHVFNLDEVLIELRRILKSGGHMLLTVPFVWDEHEVPYDFGRYTSFGIAHVLRKAGFEVVSSDKTTTYVETIFQMWNVYVSQVLLPKNKLLRVLLTPIFVSPFTVLGIVMSSMLPASKGFYHNNIVVARKP